MMRSLKMDVVFVTSVLVIIFCLLLPKVIWAVDISDTPLETTIAGRLPALVFILDNSASMDCEVMTLQAHGLFNGHCYLFPDSSYEPVNDHVFGKERALDMNERRMWQSQWSGYNLIYYCPEKAYSPWPSTPDHRFTHANLHRPLSSPVARDNDGAVMRMASEFFKVKYAQEYIPVSNAHYFTHLDTNGNGIQDDSETDIFLVTWEDGDADGRIDLSDDPGKDCRRYYRFVDDGDNYVEDNELIPVFDASVIAKLRPKLVYGQAECDQYATDAQELQNFVNWFTYYRRRSQVAAALVAKFIMQPVERKIGLYALNGNPRIAIRHVVPNQKDNGFNEPAMDNKWELLDGLYAMVSGGNTPLREALDQVGRYFHTELDSELGASPFLDTKAGGNCQRAAAVLVSDGFRNGQWTGSGNTDGYSGYPFADPWPGTLADIAMQYYQDDLAPELPDAVAPAACDFAVHQHMSTHVLSLGGLGTVEAFNVLGAGKTGCKSCACLEMVSSAQWPQPGQGQSMELPPVDQTSQTIVSVATGDSRIDDFAHAAVNGRGGYCLATAAAVAPLGLDHADFNRNAAGSAAAVAVSGTVLSTASMLFQTRYDAADWHGDLLAFPFSEAGAAVAQPPGGAIWQASSLLDSPPSDWNNRRIISYGGNWRHPQGIPFRYNCLSPSQMAALGSDLVSSSRADQDARDILDYIRGRKIERFRRRNHVLGDMVHTAPILFGETVFAGANDGMLHAFNANSGKERFAYVPSLVFGHLRALSEPDYADMHRFYVDGPCFAGEVLVNHFVRHTYLVGGLGNGGKGYFCLLVGKRERAAGPGGKQDYRWIFHADTIGEGASEDAVSTMVQWEYPRPDTADDGMDNDGDGLVDEIEELDPDLGYSFSAAYAVNANTIENAYCPVVIFGNGYNSKSGKAVLYVLDAQNGALVRKIDTGIDQDNGLSTPALVDVNLDRRVDYAYAGDLKGNMWKFDLSAEMAEHWGVAYGADVDGDGVIDAGKGDVPAPLFQAPGQPITGRPDVMAMSSMCATQAPGYMVVFGTGRFLGISDLGDTDQQSIFGIWDFGDDGDDSEYPGRLVDRDHGLLSSGLRLEKQTFASGAYPADGTYRELDTNAIVYKLVEDSRDGDDFSGNNDGPGQKDDPQSCAGWFLDFPLPPQNGLQAGERVTGNVVIRGGRAVIVSYVPNAEPCGYGGDSWIYVLKTCDGGLPDAAEAERIRPEQIPGRLNDNPVVMKDMHQNAKDYLLVNDHTGKIRTVGFTGESLGKVYWRQNSQ